MKTGSLHTAFKPLMLMAAAVLMLGSTAGCSWFKKDKNVATEDVSSAVSGSTEQVPIDAPVEPMRPTGLSPMPEMNTIYFDYDAATIREDQLARLDKNLQYLVAHPEVRAQIEGNCDERGTIEYNFNLGMRRANAVRDYFVRNGIMADRLAVASKGEEVPVETGHSEEAWAMNRRCEFLRMQ